MAIPSSFVALWRTTLLLLQQAYNFSNVNKQILTGLAQKNKLILSQ
jgi:hypothetical protein